MNRMRKRTPLLREGMITACRAATSTLLVLVLLVGAQGCRSDSAAKDAARVKASSAALVPGEPPLAAPSSFAPAVPEEWGLANGLRVLFLRDDELPLFRVSLYLPGGALWDPADQRGASGAMGDLLRQGGAGELEPDALDRALEMLAASISSSFGGEYGNLSCAGLSADFSQIMALCADVALRPRFDKTRFALWQGRVLEQIRRRGDDPETIASIAFQQLMYGSTPYGRVLVGSDIERLTIEQLAAAYQRLVRPDRALLVVSGKLDRAQVEAAVGSLFGGWPRGDIPAQTPPTVGPAPQPRLVFINKPFEQATVTIGQRGVPRLTPDYAAIELFNEVFGTGGFGSRLMRRIRADLGLAYGVYGAIQAGLVEGINAISLQTKAASTAQAIEESIQVLRGLQSGTIAAAELEETRRSVENSFVFKFSSLGRIADRRAVLRVLGYPEDYDAVHLARIAAVTPEQIRTVAETRWKIDQLVVLVVGNDQALESIRSSGLAQKMSIEVMQFDQRLVEEAP